MRSIKFPYCTFAYVSTSCCLYRTYAFLLTFVAEASVSEPFIVKAAEWNEAILKQRQAVHNESVTKDVPNMSQALLQALDLEAGDDGREYSEEVATSSSKVEVHGSDR